MKILSILAQKPSCTGSGIFLSELVSGFAHLHCEQAVVAGVTIQDAHCFPKEVDFYPVYFETASLPFPVVGMSDEMPYVSTRYRDLDEEMTKAFAGAFLKVIEEVVTNFQPDLILCHHLYYLTALVRQKYPNHKIIGLCHNTDLRQLQKIPFMRSYILEHNKFLDSVLCLNDAQKEMVQELFAIEPDKIHVTGAGYNAEVFFTGNKTQAQRRGKLIYAGKISCKKGVASLLKALSYLPYQQEEIELSLVGDAGNEKELREIKEIARRAPFTVSFTGQLSQEALAEKYRESEVFILPSFSEGLSLTMIEAIACGCKVVISDLPGLKGWLAQNLPESVVEFVQLPPLYDNDEARSQDLPAFEQRIAAGIVSIREQEYRKVGMEKISWQGICEKILTIN